MSNQWSIDLETAVDSAQTRKQVCLLKICFLKSWNYVQNYRNVTQVVEK